MCNDQGKAAAVCGGILTAIILTSCGTEGLSPLPPASSCPPSDTLKIKGGNYQAGPAPRILPKPLQVELDDANNAPIPFAPIYFKVTKGTGSLTLFNPPPRDERPSLQVETDLKGRAQVFFKQPERARFLSLVSAQSEDSQVTFRLHSTFNAGPPATPTDITAVPGPDRGEITLTWVNHADNAEYLLLEKSTDNINWSRVAKINDPGTERYLVTGLSLWDTYYFRISAWNHY